MHIILWQFTVPVANRERFEDAYGPDGDWAILFRKASGYRGTELLKNEDCYITIDRWQAAADFERFKEAFAFEYDTLDRQLEELSVDERRMGAFDSCSSLT